MQGLPAFADPNLLVGAEHFGDAGVYRLAEKMAIVQSLDFFPPIVDDPYVFGRIAAANALSDVYAIGATPKTALNIVGFPDDEVGLDVLGEILRGGAERVEAAEAVIVGGHSVRAAEITYGLSVTGVVDPARMMTNEAAAPGDVLILTKALGTGFITTAAKDGACPGDVFESACASMVQLNRSAAESALDVGTRAATDITGFGLAGHAAEMAQASGVTLTIEIGRLPRLPGAVELAGRGFRTRANATNRDHVAALSRFEGPQDSVEAEFLFDPQTSGGLLLSVRADAVEDLLARCRAGGLDSAAVIGGVGPRADVSLVIE